MQYSNTFNSISMTSDKGSGNLIEDISLLTNEELSEVSEINYFNSINVGPRLESNLHSGNRFIGNLTGSQAPRAVFVMSPILLPKSMSCVYLHSDKLAGQRDSMGPQPNQNQYIKTHKLPRRVARM